jgi:hypothetical protein
MDSRVPSPCTVDMTDLTWTDVTEDDDGNATGVLGLLWADFSSKQLRTIASRLSIKGVKNANKTDMVNKLSKTHTNRKAYNALRNRNNDQAPRKEVQCSFRLINILFSDDFAGDFATLGNIANRHVLDTGMAGNDEHFWVGVQRAFVQPNDLFDQLGFSSDDIIAAQDHIDPGKIVEHDWKKLRTIWKGVNAEYKAALTRYTVSGTHEQSFYDFCNGKLDVYYLRKNLEARPQLNDTVEADLPEACALTSDTVGSEVAGDIRSSNVSSNVSVSASKRKRGGSDVADAIREFGSSSMRSELATQKLRYMEKEDSRREKELSLREHKSMFDEWERIQVNLRSLREDMRNPSIDEDTKSDMRDDVAGLAKRKNELAIKLGF